MPLLGYLLECILALSIAEVIQEDFREGLIPSCSIDGKAQFIVRLFNVVIHEMFMRPYTENLFIEMHSFFDNLVGKS